MKAKTAEQQIAEQWESDWGELMKSPAFRRVLFQLIDDPGWCAVHAESDETNGSKVFAAQGRRSIGLQLMRAAQRIAPELYMRALNEQMNERRRLAVAPQTTEEQE